MIEYNIELFDGTTWTQYNVNPGDKYWVSRTYAHLTDAGCYVRIKDTEGNVVEADEINGKHAMMRLTEEYQLGWKECWDWLKSNGGAW